MTNAVEASGQYVDEEPANELTGIQCHGLLAGTPFLPVVLPPEGDPLLIKPDESVIGDGYPMGITGQVRQYRFRPGKGAFGIDHPFLLAQGPEPVSKILGVGEEAVIIEEAQLTGLVGADECFEEQASEQPRQHPHRQEESGLAGNPLLATDRETATRNDPVNMGMVSQARSPGMQDQGEADVGPQVFRIAGDDPQGLGGRPEQNVIDRRFVVVGDIADRGR